MSDIEWIDTTIGEYCPFIYGKSLPQNKRIEGDCPVYGSNGIIAYHNNSNVNGAGIIIGRKGSIGSIHLSLIPFWTIDTTFYIQKERIDELKFVYYLLQTLELSSMNSDSAVPGLNRDNAHSISIKIPKNQFDRENIAKKLAMFDDKIQLNTQINQTLEQIAQAIFKSWFLDFDPVKAKINVLANGGTKNDAERAAMCVISGKTEAELTQLQDRQPEKYQELAKTAALFPSEMVESELGKIPKGWGVKKIEDIIIKIPTGKKYNQKTVFTEGNIPVLDQGKSGLIGFHNDIPGVYANSENPVIVFANHTCYMRLINYDFSTIQNIFAFKGKDLDIYWVYLATLGKQEFIEYKGHFPDFLIKEIIVPHTILAEHYGAFVKSIFNKNFLNESQNIILSKIRDGLLTKLLSANIT